MQLLDSPNIFHRFEQDGKSKTAIDTGIQASGHSFSRIREQFTGSAILASLNKNTVETREIQIDQFFSHEKRVYIILDEYFSGNCLREYFAYSDFSPQKRECMRLMGMIIHSLSDRLSAQINPNHILHSDGQILLLPKEWSQIISVNESEASQQKGFEQINFPDIENLEPQRSQLHAYASSLYFMISGKWPTEGRDVHFQHRLKRKKTYRPIEMLLPRISEDLANWFYQALRMETDDYLLPLQYLDAMEIDAISASEDNSELSRVQSYQKSLKREELRVGIKKKAGLIIALTAVLVTFLVLGINAIQQATRDLVVTGMSPDEVVRNFYESYNTRDHGFMSEATHRGAARNIIDQVASLYAVSAIREATEMRSVFISAPEWLEKAENERESLQEYTVFGVTDLSLTRTEPPEPDAVRFIVNYTLWFPEEGELEGEHITEQLTLMEFRRGWKIVSLEDLLNHHQ